MSNDEFVTERIVVDVPEDAGTLDERREIAFAMARDKSMVYALPCSWTIVEEKDDTFVIIHKYPYHED